MLENGLRASQSDSFDHGGPRLSDRESRPQEWLLQGNLPGKSIV
jgi:hypothetical protein